MLDWLYRVFTWRALRLWLINRNRPVHPDCCEGKLRKDHVGCRGAHVRHGYCVHCGALTCSRSGRINPTSLRREVPYTCDDCYWQHLGSVRQTDLRRERVRRDWEKVTVPINGDAIITTQMAEQYPGRARAAIRAFDASDAEFATVPNLPAAALQETICTLGLDGELYAEQRDDTTVIRRIPDRARDAD